VAGQAEFKRLERRVERLERSMGSVRRDPGADLGRARSLLFDDLRAGREVEPVEFAARNDLTLESVERAVAEFMEKGWAVAKDDEAP